MTTVLVDDWVLARKRTGVGHYLASVLAHWPDDSTVTLVRAHALTARALQRSGLNASALPSLDKLTAVRLQPLGQVAHSQLQRPPRDSSTARRAWNAFNARYLQLRRFASRADLFFEPNHIPPADLRPAVTTIHDLSVLELPQFHPPHRVADWRRRLERGLQWTTHWICVSQATADSMRRILNIAPERITVIPLASRWTSPPQSWTPQRLRSQLGLPERYIVCLGTIEPRKNTLRLLDALQHVSEAWRAAHPVILVGAPGWGDANFWRSLADHPRAADVLATGYADDSVALAIVAGASAMLYPSLYEGFGLPPLEAMSLGVPVAASTAPSLREVCDSSAMLIDPNDTNGWRDAMMQICEPGPQREHLTERGLRRAAQFSWTRTAQAHHDLFAQVGGAKL